MAALPAPAAAPAAASGSLALHRLACVTAAATLVLIFAGGLVTTTGSGLAVPDWPLSFGQVFPAMQGGVLYEHGHRLIASAVGLLTVVLAVGVVLREPRGRVRGLAVAAALAVVLQGVLGGVTVLYRLPTAVSVSHACLAQAFLLLAVALAVLTGPGWRAREASAADRPLARLAAATTAAVFAQLVVGAVMRHTGAGLAIRDFPLAAGRLVPPLDDPAVRLHFLHRAGALVVLVLVAWTVGRALAAPRGCWTRGPALLLAALVPLQVALGATAVLSLKAVVPTTAHVATGAAVLAASFALALRARRAA